jgi:hypothetical protein
MAAKSRACDSDANTTKLIEGRPYQRLVEIVNTPENYVLGLFQGPPGGAYYEIRVVFKKR